MPVGLVMDVSEIDFIIMVDIFGILLLVSLVVTLVRSLVFTLDIILARRQTKKSVSKTRKIEIVLICPLDERDTNIGLCRVMFDVRKTCQKNSKNFQNGKSD